MLKEQVYKLDDEGLNTLFCEIESILNARPITTVSSDPNDLAPLTPNDILLFKSNTSFPPGLFSESDNYTRRRWRQVQYLSDVFWKRWIHEYLPLLQKRSKWVRPQKNISVGDIVLIAENSPRGAWALGKVEKVYPDKDNNVRFCDIRTKTNILRRPIHKLVTVLESEDK